MMWPASARPYCPADAYGFTRVDGAALLSFSPDETVLAACVGGGVNFYETRALFASAAGGAGGAPGPGATPFKRQRLGSWQAAGPQHQSRRASLPVCDVCVSVCVCVCVCVCVFKSRLGRSSMSKQPG